MMRTSLTSTLIIFFEELVRVLLPHRLDPVRVGDVPIDGLLDRALEGVSRLPAELLDLGGVNRITKVVPRPVRDVMDQGFRLMQFLQDGLNDIEVGLLVMAPDVIDLAIDAMLTKLS